MSSRDRPTFVTVAKAIGRKFSGPLERGWGDTVIGPVDPMENSELRPPSEDPTTIGSFDPTEPTGLYPEAGPSRGQAKGANRRTRKK